jgi:UPF0755 protein
MGGLAIDGAHFFSEPLANHGPQVVEIAPGTRFRDLVAQLHSEGLIGSVRGEGYFAAYARLTGQADRVKSGEYRVPADTKPAQLLALLVSGKTVRHQLEIIEGWRFSKIMQVIEHDPDLKHTLRGDSDHQIMAALGHPDQKPEGRFMPDTYMFPRGMTDVAFLKRAYNAMQQFLDKAWPDRAANLVIDSKYKALIMASLIEKETAVPKERRRISGVFNRRLKKGMRLQTDASVIYGIPDFNGRIHLSDLRRDTPYNTYTRSGLPPTPIAAPRALRSAPLCIPSGGRLCISWPAAMAPTFFPTPWPSKTPRCANISWGGHELCPPRAAVRL